VFIVMYYLVLILEKYEINAGPSGRAVCA